jgi:4-amino-4-deoxy-L-arabinose transferase-like glycosyltransferase
MASQYTPARIELSSRWLVGILLLAVLITFLNLGRLPLFDEDEGEYAQVAVEMAHSGNFITPTLNGQPFFEKPILTFWLQAPLVHAFGAHAGVFRLPSALACLAWIMLLVGFGRRFFGEEAGWLAGVLCATSLGVVVSGHAGAMDGVLSLLVAAAGFDIYRAWVDQSRWAEWRVYVWMALGLLAKGPVAVLIPFLVSGLFYLSQRDGARWLRSLINPLGWLTFLAIALPWYVAQYHAMGQPFLDYFLFHENLGRMVGSLQGHGGNIFYYLPVILLIALPHTSLLLRAGATGIAERSNPLVRFLLIWFVVVLVVFSLASTKLPHYLLIGLTPVFLLMAHYRTRLQSRFFTVLPFFLMLALTAALPTLVATLAARESNPYLRELLARGPEVFDASYWVMAVTLAAFSAVILIMTHRFAPQRAPWRLLPGLGLAANLLLWGVWLPAAADLQQAPLVEAAQLAHTFPQPIVADNRMPSFAVLVGHATVNRAPLPNDVVFLRADAEANLAEHETLYSKGGLRLVRMSESSPTK